ncbi:hypothetical protein [Undibacterium griseum]|uniref:Uncharacterized protein n=1 Tax=Undibacterium griseum TaxID=2762295 RepID=A0ABR6YPQ0_9BURK|nr:hypothetical protein [Undibacterium griseum]MBC3885870.1 hypothetical protein [Undibacterium griseum]
MATFIEMNCIDTLKRLWHVFWTPFWITLTFGFISLKVNPYWKNVLLNAISGQLAITLVKLFFYFSFIFLGLATALKSVPYLASFFRSSGTRLAELTFDYTTTTLGVFVGLMLIEMYEFDPATNAVMLRYSILVMALMLVTISISVNLVTGKFDTYLPVPNVSIRLCGLALVIIATTSLGKEPWKEALPTETKCELEKNTPPPDNLDTSKIGTSAR